MCNIICFKMISIFLYSIFEWFVNFVAEVENISFIATDDDDNEFDGIDDDIFVESKQLVFCYLPPMDTMSQCIYSSQNT